MHRVLHLYQQFTARAEGLGSDGTVSLGARLCFILVLLGYYWSSAMTKLSDGFFGFLVPTIGAYYQILPGITEAAGYDVTAINPVFTLIVLLGSWAEIILPLLLLIGLFTRFAAVSMIGFIFVQSIVDVLGHDVIAGGWLDRASDGLILDQRLFWIFVLWVLVVKGPGPVSLDRLLNIDT